MHAPDAVIALGSFSSTSTITDPKLSNRDSCKILEPTDYRGISEAQYFPYVNLAALPSDERTGSTIYANCGNNIPVTWPTNTPYNPPYSILSSQKMTLMVQATCMKAFQTVKPSAHPNLCHSFLMSSKSTKKIRLIFQVA